MTFLTPKPHKMTMFQPKNWIFARNPTFKKPPVYTQQIILQRATEKLKQNEGGGSHGIAKIKSSQVCVKPNGFYLSDTAGSAIYKSEIRIPEPRLNWQEDPMGGMKNVGQNLGQSSVQNSSQNTVENTGQIPGLHLEQKNLQNPTRTDQGFEQHKIHKNARTDFDRNFNNGRTSDYHSSEFQASNMHFTSSNESNPASNGQTNSTMHRDKKIVKKTCKKLKKT